MTYAEVLEKLKKASLLGSVLGLSRIEKLLEMLDNPQDKLKIIHVSGTNGKGSFSAILSSVLTEAGYKTGVFSSPSLMTVNDSFRINREIVSDDFFADIMSDVFEKAEQMPDSPTEFELLTATAFQMFYKAECDICIIECGLGGDTDSTNVIKSPVLSVITNVQLDHCGILGNTLSEIARHKSGIIKNNCPVLYGGNRDEAFEVISKKADDLNVKLFLTDKTLLSDVNVTINGTEFSFGNYKNLNLSLVGSYQSENAVNVLTAIEILKKYGFVIADDALCKGFEKTVWQGRFEIVRKNPPVIFDGAHNPCGMHETVRTVKNCFGEGKTAVLMGVMADKDYNLYADMIRDIADTVFTVTPDNSRSLSAVELADYFNKNNVNATAYETFADGLNASLEYVEEKNIPLIVMGSLYMYREFRLNLK
ncbi:MAG: bifunctional folylpolyglutamate synthase/dihydrofolate synthase [Oscillospiraceae bacterium]|nr:bifunctional folylpolyglutamate synthase/dihydrofolate synthase [Oscillospiraceae bacterium]